jgi:hypothetical protein
MNSSLLGAASGMGQSPMSMRWRPRRSGGRLILVERDVRVAPFFDETR